MTCPLVSDSIVKSKPFKFIVGRAKTPMTVHVAALAHHSPVLRQLVSGPMTEARDGCATLDDIDEATFVRFCQYAYTGQYYVPGAMIASVSEDHQVSHPPDIHFPHISPSSGGGLC